MASIPTDDHLLSVVSSAVDVSEPITNAWNISTAKDEVTISRIDRSFCYEDIIIQVRRFDLKPTKNNCGIKGREYPFQSPPRTIRAII